MAAVQVPCTFQLGICPCTAASQCVSGCSVCCCSLASYRHGAYSAAHTCVRLVCPLRSPVHRSFFSFNLAPGCCPDALRRSARGLQPGWRITAPAWCPCTAAGYVAALGPHALYCEQGWARVRRVLLAASLCVPGGSCPVWAFQSGAQGRLWFSRLRGRA